MITVLTKDDMQAMKTARISAVRTKLKPIASSLLMVIVLPDRTGLIMLKEKIKAAKIKQKAKKFRKLEETLPTSGRINAPRSGTKIIAKSIVWYLI